MGSQMGHQGLFVEEVGLGPLEGLLVLHFLFIVEGLEGFFGATAGEQPVPGPFFFETFLFQAAAFAVAGLLEFEPVGRQAPEVLGRGAPGLELPLGGFVQPGLDLGETLLLGFAGLHRAGQRLAGRVGLVPPELQDALQGELELLSGHGSNFLGDGA